jgi:glycosyltransferase involved in cell wall biosynthesis
MPEVESSDTLNQEYLPSGALQVPSRQTTTALREQASSEDRPFRIAYFVSHPIQYQAPLLRRIAALPGISLKVFFFSDISVRSYVDQGFGVTVKWDVPLLDGYESEFLPTIRNRGRLAFADPICKGVYEKLKDGNFDAVWLHGYHTLNHLQVLLAAKRLNLPLLMRAEPTLIDRPRTTSKMLAKSYAFRLLRHAITAVMPISELNKEYWNTYLGPATPQFPMPYAVDNQFFRDKSVQAEETIEVLRAELGLAQGRPVILYCSKLQTRKRCIDLVNAYLLLCSNLNLPEKPYLLIIGDGEERNQVEARIQESKDPDIKMLGFRNQSELPRYFSLCDVFVLPSVSEPFGLIVNEVMNAGRAVIVTNEVGCQRDLVQDQVNGMVVPPQNIPALANALQYVLEKPERAKEMGKKGLERIRTFSFDQDIEGLMAAVDYVKRTRQIA